MATSSFAGTTAGLTVTFDAITEGFQDQGHALEEWRVPIVVYSAADWGALFQMRTPREYISIRFCPSVPGTITTTLDVGGGAGEGTLTIDTLDPHTAILTDLQSSAPIGNSEARQAVASFIVTG